MAIYDYAYARGFDQNTLTNTEDAFGRYPQGQIVPLGSVQRKTLDRNIQYNGSRLILWTFGPMSNADFTLLIIGLFDDFETENSELTIDTRARDNNFHRYNAIAHTPIEGQDYTRMPHGDVDGLRIRIDILEELDSGGGFSIGFSLGFTA